MAKLGANSPESGLTRFVTSAFTRNLPYKAVALFLALILWLVVERQTPRAQAERVDVQLVLRLDNGLVRVSPLPEVRALISASAEELLTLETDRPRILRSFQADVADSVIVNIRVRDVTLPAGTRARVINVQPQSFVVRFDSLMQKTVPVRSALSVTAGAGITIAGSPRFEPDSVSIVGKRQIVSRITSVATEARDIVVTDSTGIRVRLVSPADGVDVVPPETTARVPIVRTFQ